MSTPKADPGSASGAEHLPAEASGGAKEKAAWSAGDKYTALFNAIDEGFYLAEVIFDESGRAVDIFYHEENPAAVRILGASMKGKKLTEVSPQYEQYWFDILGGVAATGESQRLERYAQVDHKWFSFYVTRLGAEGSRQIAIVFQDVTDLKRARQELEQSRNLLQSMFDVSYNGLSVLESLRDEKGGLLDMRYVFANEATKKVYKRYDLEGKLYSEVHAGFKGSDYFNVVKRVLETGEPYRYQLHYHFEDLDNWFDISTVRLGDGVVVSFEDISEIKKAELSLREREERKAFLLQLSDALRPLSNPIDIQEAATRTTMDYFGADRCYYCEIENDTAIVRHDAAREGLPSVAASYPLGGMPIFKAVLDAGRPFVVADSNTTELMDEGLRQLCIRMQIISYVNVPLIKNGHPVGFLCLTQCAQRAWTEAEVALVEEVAERVWASVERAKAESAIAADLRDMQVLQQLSEHLVLENDADVIYQELVEAAITLTAADAGTIQLFDEETQDLVLLATRGFEKQFTDHFLRVKSGSSTSCGRALANKQRTFVDFDAPEDPDGCLRRHLEAGYLSAQSTPLLNRAGKPVGMLSTHWRSHHRPTGRELRFLDLLARQAADLLERRQAGDVQRKSEEKYRSLFNNINQGFGIAELQFDEENKLLDYRWLEVNARFEELLGMSMRPFLEGKTVRQVYPGQWEQQAWRPIFAKVALSGEAARFEQHSPYVDRWLDMYVFRCGAADERQIAVLFNNITERKRREENARFLAEIAAEFSRLSAPGEIIKKVCGKIGTNMKVANCSFVDIDESAEKEMIPIYNWFSSGERGFPEAFRIRDYLSEEFERACRANEIIVVSDTNKDERTNAAAYNALRVNSFIVVPFFRDGVWTNFLACSGEEAREWRPDEIELLRELANVIFPRLDKARADEKLRVSEERKAFLLQLSDSLRSLSDTVEIERYVCRLLGTHVQADRSYYAELEGDSIVVRQDYYKSEFPSVAGAYASQSFASIVAELQEGNPVIIEDIKTDSLLTEGEREICPALGITAFISSPIIKGERLVAYLGLSSVTARKWTGEEIELLSEVAERTWSAVERVKAEAALRESEERLRTLANALPQVIWTNDAHGRATYFNQRWFEYTGLTYAQSAGPGWQAIVHPEDARASIEKWNQAQAEGAMFDTEYRLLGHDGSYRWFIGRNVPLKDESGMVRAWFGSATDIDDLKKTEEALSESEARLRATMESAADYAIITMDTERRVERWSSGAAKIFGYTEAEMMGQTADIIFTDEDRAAGAPQQEVEMARDTGRAADERWHQGRDGNRFFGSGVMRPIFNPALSGYVKVLRDVTEQKKTEETLRIMEERYRIALNSAEMAAWDWNLASNEITWNDQHFRILGLEPSSRKIDVGFFLQFVHEQDRQHVDDALRMALNETGTYQAEFRIIRADNKELRWMTGYGKVVEKKDGHSTRMVGVMYDSTEQRLFTEELSRLVTERTIELQRSNEDLRQFAHVASHDLKEPIRKIQTFNNRVLDEYADAIPPKVKTYAEKIGTAAERMISMVEGVLRYSKLGSLKQEPETVDLNEIIRQIASDLDVLVEQKKAIIRGESLPTLKASATLLYQLFYNLILNSLKFSKEEEPPRIDIHCERVQVGEKKFFRITVADNGIGFEQEFAQDIFKTFTRLHPVEDYEGTGLGLALCKKIVERHGGTISAHGEPDRGAIFTILLPLWDE
jgi:PAS domain S-box-containing protein